MRQPPPCQIRLKYGLLIKKLWGGCFGKKQISSAQPPEPLNAEPAPEEMPRGRKKPYVKPIEEGEKTNE